MSSINNFGYSEMLPDSRAYLRPLSSLSLPSNSADSDFLPYCFGSASVSASNSRMGISSTSGNTSVGSSPIPTEQDIDQILRKAVELLALRSQALKKANASSRITDATTTAAAAAYRNGGVSSLYDFPIANPTTNSTTALPEKQQTHHQRPRHLPPIARRSPNPESYKTVMCQAWLESGVCTFGENCRFAHGEEELRPCKLPTKNPKYKTKLCDKYTMVGLCPYGDRCLFIHPESSNAHNPYIRPDRYLEIQRKRALLASLKGASSGGGIPRTPLSSRTTNRPPPSWPLESPAFFSAHRDLDQLLRVPLKSESNESSPTATLVPEDFTRTPVVGSAALNDITNQVVTSVKATPDIAGTTGNLKSHDSPDSGIASSTEVFAAAAVTTATASSSSDYPFQIAIHTDNLARSLACEFKVD